MRPWLCVLISSVGIAVSAQDRPDFSGEWVLMSPKDAGSEVASMLTVRQTFRRESVVGKPLDTPLVTLTIERGFEDGVRSATYTIGVVGGTVGALDANGQSASPDGHPTQTRFSYTWEGDSIVIENGRYSGPARDAGLYSERTEVWSLDRQGTLSVTVMERASGKKPQQTTLIYRRR